jgi:hypothetical protein
MLYISSRVLAFAVFGLSAREVLSGHTPLRGIAARLLRRHAIDGRRGGAERDAAVDVQRLFLADGLPLVPSCSAFSRCRSYCDLIAPPQS